MSASTEWDDLTGGQTVTIAARNAYSNYGVPSFSTAASTYKARWVEKRGTVRDADGTEHNQRGILWVFSTATFAPDAKVTLPDGTTPPVLAVEAFSDENGRYQHLKLTMGW